MITIANNVKTASRSSDEVLKWTLQSAVLNVEVWKPDVH